MSWNAQNIEETGQNGSKSLTTIIFVKFERYCPPTLIAMEKKWAPNSKCCANQWTGFYMITASVVKWLSLISDCLIKKELCSDAICLIIAIGGNQPIVLLPKDITKFSSLHLFYSLCRVRRRQTNHLPQKTKHRVLKQKDKNSLNFYLW